MKIKVNKLGASKLFKDWGVLIFSLATFLPLLVAYLAASQPDRKEVAREEPQPKRDTIVPRKEGLTVNSTPPLSPPIPIKEADKSNLIPTRIKNDQAALASAKTSAETITPKTKPAPVAKAEKPRTKPAPLAVPVGYTPPPLEIKVAIERDINTVSVGVSSPGIISDQNGRFLQSLSPNQGVWISPGAGGLNMGNSSLPGVVFIQAQNNGLVYVNDRWYRGRVLIVSQDSNLLVVNYVNLEEYLYSVVGSEMHPTAPTEALKAQAIAARSYALVHMIRPASPWFHLGNTQRWQVYKGVQSEYNTGHHAVNETAGQILSYRGGVVESLYAATDEIVSWAHGGKGMSQTGAYELANQGYDYQRILGYYYPGVGLARLVLQR